MTELPSSALFDPFNWFGSRPGPSVTDGGLVQPILPGWSFGTLIVNEQNSSSPATEREILAHESYGRQIGKLIDAVCELIELRGGAKDSEAFAELLALQSRVEAIKTNSAAERLEQMRSDLARLKAHDSVAYKAAVKGLRALLS